MTSGVEEDGNDEHEGTYSNEGAFTDYKFDEERIEELFQKLDVNKDGRLDINELSDGLHRLKIHREPEQAKTIIKKGDINKDNHLSFEEFWKYCQEHEKKLWLVFKQIDTNNSGELTSDEIKTAFEDLGVHMSDSELRDMLRKMDLDGHGQGIDWEEWRDFHQLHPALHRKEPMKELGEWHKKMWNHAHIDTAGDVGDLPEDLYEDEKLKGHWWKQLLSGAVAGVVSRTCTAPLDRLKILLQVHAGSTKNNWSLQRGFQKMYSEGGVKSLWRGNLVNCVKIGPETAIKFYAYEWMKGKLTKGNPDNCQIGIGTRFLAGAFAGSCSQTSIYPMEVLKTRLALGKTGEYRNLVDCAKKVYMKDGLRVFFKGLVPGIIGVVPYAGIDLCVYETLKVTWLTRHTNDSEEPSAPVLLLCGAMSSSCGQLCSYPFALVRTKLQAQTTDPTFTGIRANGMTDMFKQIVQQNGYLGLYRGLVPNFLKVLPAVSISYLVYEKTRTFLGMKT